MLNLFNSTSSKTVTFSLGELLQLQPAADFLQTFQLGKQYEANIKLCEGFVVRGRKMAPPGHHRVHKKSAKVFNPYRVVGENEKHFKEKSNLTQDLESVVMLLKREFGHDS